MLDVDLADVELEAREDDLVAAAAQVADFAVRNLRVADEDALRDRLEEVGALGLLANPRRPLLPNVRLARALTRLAHHRGAPSYHDEAARVLGAYAGDLAAYRFSRSAPLPREGYPGLVDAEADLVRQLAQAIAASLREIGGDRQGP